MMMLSEQTTSQFIAVPCYETRVLPRFGQAREFYFAEVDPSKQKILNLQRQQWNPRYDPPMTLWLAENRAQGVLCGGIHPSFQMTLMADGMWIRWGFRGEVEEVIEKWLKGEFCGTLADGSFASAGCCPVSTKRRNRRRPQLGR